MAMKHPIDDPEPSKSNVMKKVASSLGLPVVDIKVAKPMTQLVLIIQESSFYADTTEEFYHLTSLEEYRKFHNSLIDINKEYTGTNRLLNSPIDISMLDKYKGMLMIRGIEFMEINCR